MILRKSIILLNLLLILLAGNAQNFPVENLNDNMQRFYKGCMALREGVIRKNVISLDRAIELLDEEPQNVDRIQLYPLLMENIDTVNQVSMKGHMYYSAEYADYFKETMGVGTFNESAEALRSTPTNCQIAHRAVKAKSKVRYQVRMAGDCVLYVVAEIGGSIQVSAKVGEGETIVGEPFENGSVSYLKWTMDSFPPQMVTLTVENISDENISFVIASN